MSIEDSNTPHGNATGVQAQASGSFGEVTDKARQDLDAATQQAAEDVRELSHQAGAKVGEVTDTAKSFAADQKDLAASQINGVAAAIMKVADELEGSDQRTVARYARDLATGLSGMGKTIETRDVDDLMGLGEDFGRKQPVAFLGAAALAGFVASRFALASAHRRESKPATDRGLGEEQSTEYRPGAPPAYGGSGSQNSTGGQ